MRPPIRRVLSVLEFIASSAVLMRGGAEERLACKGSRRDVPASGIKDRASALSNDPRRLLYGRLSEKASTRTAERSARSGLLRLAGGLIRADRGAGRLRLRRARIPPARTSRRPPTAG